MNSALYSCEQMLVHSWENSLLLMLKERSTALPSYKLMRCLLGLVVPIDCYTISLPLSSLLPLKYKLLTSHFFIAF